MHRSQTEVTTKSAPPRGRWSRYGPPAVVLAMLALVGGVALLPNATREVPEIEIPPVNVRLQQLAPLPELADVLTLTAVVEPERVVRVPAEVSARIERRGTRSQAVSGRGRTWEAGSPIEEGEPVSAGDPIAYLNTDLLKARYERARAQLEYDQRELVRKTDLAERGIVSRTELDDAETRRAISQAALNEMARELDRAVITAPQRGTLNRWLMEVGEFANPGDPVAELVDTYTVKVVVEVPERDVGVLRVGDEAVVVADPGAPRPLTAPITYISAVADAGTRTTRVEISVDNSAAELRSGQIVQVQLTRRVLRDVIMIPLDSVIPLEHGRMVYVAEDGVAAPREVELGLIRGRNVQVLAGLRPGERLIVDGQRYVGAGQRLNVVAEQ
jgi:membrane fusion protein (multidrug efflux system)